MTLMQHMVVWGPIVIAPFFLMVLGSLFYMTYYLITNSLVGKSIDYYCLLFWPMVASEYRRYTREDKGKTGI
jgi:hypothetical protein